jgi:16S rRNA (guanine527-N7)-methyltransferase
MNAKQIRAVLQGYFSPLPYGIEDQVCKYVGLIEVWNRKISLTSIREPEEIVRRHFGESIFALALGDCLDGRLADVGTGAGFPGVALKLAKPGVSLVLIEPNKKKCAFLHEVVRSLNLKNVEIISARFEEAQIAANSLSCVVSRALGQHTEILKWAKRRVAPGGGIMLWLGRAGSDELGNSAGWEWEDPRTIPGARSRYILKGRAV